MSPLLPLLAPGLAALLIAAIATPLVRRLAWLWGLVDDPGTGAHKSHLTPTPYGGGIAIFLAFLLALLPPLLADPETSLLRPGESLALFALLAGAGLLFAIGLTDDWRGLPPLLRFLVQMGAIALLVVAVPACRLLLVPSHPALDASLTVLWIGAMTNAFNFLDNMDGLSAGIAAIALVFLGFMALLCNEVGLALLCLTLFGALCGFLFYNLPPASIFMGDAGGLFLGFAISAASVAISQACAHATLYSALQLAPLLVLAVPVYDFATVNLIRLRQGRPPWVGDKNHISHRLVRCGLSRRGAVLCIYLLTFLSGLPALLALHQGESLWLLATPLLALAAALAELVYQRPA